MLAWSVAFNDALYGPAAYHVNKISIKIQGHSVFSESGWITAKCVLKFDFNCMTGKHGSGELLHCVPRRICTRTIAAHSQLAMPRKTWRAHGTPRRANKKHVLTLTTCAGQGLHYMC